MASTTQDEITKPTKDVGTESESKAVPESNDDRESQNNKQSESPVEQNDKSTSSDSGEIEASRKARERMEKFKALKARAVG